MGDDDWDPFAVDGGDDEPAPVAVSAAAEDVEEETEAIKIGPGDIEEITKNAMERAVALQEWLKMDQAGQPDLTLHTPTCTADNWTHTAVELKIGKGIAYIILNKPDTNNTLDDEINYALRDAVYALHSRTDIRIVVITARGKMFCAGGDPVAKDDASIPGLKPPTEEVQQARKELRERAYKSGYFDEEADMIAVTSMKDLWNINVLPQLTVCILNGSAMGGGVGLLCSADVTISIKKAHVTMSDVKIGSVPAMIAPYVIGKVGPGKAKILVTQGESKSADEAMDLGMVQYVVEDMGGANKILKDMAKSVAEISPLAVKQSKELIYALAARAITHPVMWYAIKRMKEILNDADVDRPWAKSPVEVMEPPPW